MVNGFSAHILFDSGATRSFVSLALVKKFRDALRTPDSPLEVEIMNDRTVRAARVFQRSVLNMFWARFLIDGFDSFERIEGDHQDGLVSV